jgi:hypothetical protein
VSGPQVDVLAAMSNASRLAELTDAKPEVRQQIKDARASVAELIEALRMADEWIREAVNHAGCKLPSSATLYQNSQALARVGGAL